MHPETNEFLSRYALALSDLRLVVWKNVVLATAVDIEFGSENSGGHGTALDVPTRAPSSPRALPTHIAIRFAP